MGGGRRSFGCRKAGIQLLRSEMGREEISLVCAYVYIFIYFCYNLCYCIRYYFQLYILVHIMKSLCAIIFHLPFRSLRTLQF